jgi:polyhydroxybutyrate depolymerase
MKKQIVLAVVIAVTTLGVIAQTTRQKIRDKVRTARENRTENKSHAAPNNGSYVVGKNRFTTNVNGDTREYYVHVPKSYDKNAATPVVFMLHGTSGDGLKFYNISGWKEVGEAENILTVFPSSWRHCIIDDGVRKNTTKWNIYPGSFEYCPGEVPKDDIKFLNQVIDEMCGKFNVNQKMIYFVGFSNGGQMTARVGVEMSDRVAAVVSSAGMLRPGTSYTPKRLLPNLVQVGNKDDRYFGTTAGPMNFDQLFAQFPFFKGMVGTYAATYKLNPNYTTGGNPNNILYLDAQGTSGDPNNVFRFALIKNMYHVYPNGENFRLEGAEMNWQWLKQYKLP